MNRLLKRWILLMAMLALSSSSVLAQSYVGKWSGEGNANDVNGVHNGLEVGNVWYEAEGKVGQAFKFDGSAGRVEIPDHPDLDIAGGMTLSAWIKLDPNSKSGYILNKEDNVVNNNPRRGWSVHVNGINNTCSNRQKCIGSLAFNIFSSNGARAGVNTAGFNAPNYMDNQWHHFVGTYDATTQKVSVYMDGAFIGASSGTITDVGLNNLPVIIGGRNNGSGGGYYPTGLIDEVAMYNETLDETEIDDLTNDTPSPTGLPWVDVWDSSDPDNYVLVGQIQTIQTAETGKAHYDFRSASGHPTDVNLGNKNANIWVHEDTGSGDLTFGFIFSKDNGVVRNHASTNFRIVDSNSDPYVSQDDDGPHEAKESPPGSDAFLGTFAYGNNSDGIAVSGISGDNWTIIIDAVDFGNITKWFAASGEDPNSRSDDITLTLGNEYRLTPAGNPPSGQSVVVEDTTPPEITLNGEDLVVVECGDTYEDAGVEVTDNTDTEPALTTEGDVNTDELGAYTITYTATDASGNTATATRTVQVVDTIAPSLTINNGSIIAECTGPNGTVVDLGSVTAEDVCDSAPVITNNAPAEFSMGTTTVTWTATDASGNSTEGEQLVTIVDTTSPDLTVPGDIIAEATSPEGASVDLGVASASDVCDPDPAITSDGALSVYPLGSTTVTWTATDASNNATSGEQVVNVVDTTPPAVNFSLNTGTLWPPNHKMVQVASGISASDIADEDPSVVITVTSDEDINGSGDGNTDVDWEVSNGTVYLRAERDGGQDGRVYTVVVVATDEAGNTTTMTGTVEVPHDQKVASADTGNGKGKGKAKKLVVVSQSVTPTLVVGEAKVIAGQSSGVALSQGASVTVVGAGPVVADQLLNISGEADVASRLQELVVQNHMFSLSQNHPNPFNPETVIGYGLAEASDVRLIIYNVLGQQVRELVNASQAPGQYAVRWDGRNALGAQVTSGVYIYRLVAGTQVEMRKMILLK